MSEEKQKKFNRISKEGRIGVTNVKTKYGDRYQLEFSKTDKDKKWENYKLKFIDPKLEKILPKDVKDAFLREKDIINCGLAIFKCFGKAIVELLSDDELEKITGIKVKGD